MISNGATIKEIKQAKGNIKKGDWVQIFSGIGEGKTFKIESFAMSGMNKPVAYGRDGIGPIPLENLRRFKPQGK
jgi:hypothetical protein